MQGKDSEEKQLSEATATNAVECAADDVIMLILSYLETTNDVNRYANTSRNSCRQTSLFYKTPFGQGLKLAELLEKNASQFSQDLSSLKSIGFSDFFTSQLVGGFSTPWYIGIIYNASSICKKMPTKEFLEDVLFFLTKSFYRSAAGLGSLLVWDMYRNNVTMEEEALAHVNIPDPDNENPRLKRFLQKYPFINDLLNSYYERKTSLKPIHSYATLSEKVEYITDNKLDSCVTGDLNHTSSTFKKVLAATRGSKMTLFKEQINEALKDEPYSQVIVNSYAK